MDPDIPSNDEGGSPNADDPTSQPTDQESAALQAARVARVRDYQVESLAKKDALAANLGSINGGLMRIATWMDETIQHAMLDGPQTIERLLHLKPALDSHARVVRQVDRFAQIEIRAAESHKPKATGDTGDTECLEPSPVTEVDEAKIL